MDINLISTFDDSKVLESLERLESAMNGIAQNSAKMSQTLAESMARLSEQTEAFNKSAEEQANKLKDAAKNSDELGKSTSSLKGYLKNLIDDFKIGGKSLSEWKVHLTSVQEGLKGAEVASGGASKGFGLLNTVMKANVIGAVIVVISAIIAYLNKFGDVTKKVEQIWGGITAVFDVAKKKFADLGEVILKYYEIMFKVVTLDWHGAFVSLGEGVDLVKDKFGNLAGEIRAAYDEGSQLVELRQRMLDLENELIIIVAKKEALLARTRLAQDDENKSLAQRIGLARAAAKIDVDIAETKLYLAEKNLRLTQREKEIGKATKEDVIAATVKQIQAEEALYEVKDSNLKRIQALQRQAAAEQKRRDAEAKKAQDELNKLIEQYRKARQKIQDEERTSSATGIEKILGDLEINLRKLEERKNELIALAKATGQEFDLAPAFEKLQKDLIAEANKLIFLAEQELAKLPIAIDNTINGPSGKEKEIKLGVDLVANPPDLDFYDRFLVLKAKILNALGVTDAEAKALYGALGNAASSAFEGLQELTDAYIDRQDRLIDKIQESIDKQTEAVNVEKANAEKGLANNLAIEKAKLDGLQAQREKAEEKRLELQKKAARQQLVIDSLQQASSLTTSAGNLLAHESTKGIAGVVIALGAIALMFKIFASAKANAIKNTSAEKLRKGKRISGRSHEEGGEGHLGVDGRWYEVEDAEWVIGTRESREHDRFLARLNAGAYRGKDLMQIVDRVDVMHRHSSRIGQIADDTALVHATASKMALWGATEQAADRIIKAIEERPQIAPLGGYLSIKKTKSGVTREKKSS